ncbi:MAG: DUF599 family protein [Gammaproteobacteria bacterium]|nr:DUF599 family protein [Gammaproteobacteria bacterium]
MIYISNFFSNIGWIDIIAAMLLFGTYWLYPFTAKRLFGEDIGTRMLIWRNEWAQQLLWREERITDVSLVQGLIRNVSFFATTTVFVISGLVALLGSSSSIVERLNTLPHFDPVTEETVFMKIAALLILAIIAFFKFGWSMRLHAYALLMVGAVPHPEERGSKYALSIAQRIASMSTLASQHFLGGVRAYYFGFSAIPWFLSPWLFFLSLGLVLIVATRREFLSSSFAIAAPPTQELPEKPNLSQHTSEKK